MSQQPSIAEQLAEKYAALSEIREMFASAIDEALELAAQEAEKHAKEMESRGEYEVDGYSIAQRIRALKSKEQS